MSTNRTKTALAYVLTQEKKNGNATLDFLLQAIDDAWVELLIEEAHSHTVSTYLLSTYTPSLRGIRVEQHTTFSLYVKDHWYIFAGGIWQVSWSPSDKCLELYMLCSSQIDLVEIAQLPLSAEEERVELAKKFAHHRLVARAHFVRRFPELATGETAFKKIEVVSCEEVRVDLFGEKLGRGFAHEFPAQAWIITLLCSPEEEAPAREQYVLVGYYPSLPPYICYRLTKTNGALSLGRAY